MHHAKEILNRKFSISKQKMYTEIILCPITVVYKTHWFSYFIKKILNKNLKLNLEFVWNKQSIFRYISEYGTLYNHLSKKME